MGLVEVGEGGQVPLGWGSLPTYNRAASGWGCGEHPGEPRPPAPHCGLGPELPEPIPGHGKGSVVCGGASATFSGPGPTLVCLWPGAWRVLHPPLTLPVQVTPGLAQPSSAGSLGQWWAGLELPTRLVSGHVVGTEPRG